MVLFNRSTHLIQRLIIQQKCRYSTNRTCLYDLHRKHDAKLVPFSGYEMPVQYADQSIVESSVHTRQHVSLFDVSHMLQTKIFGRHRVEFLESLMTADIQGLNENQGTLSVFTNERGGIRDDLIVTKTPDGYIYMVTNAGCIDKDLPYLQENAAKWCQNGKDVSVEPMHGHGLVAVQGPEMVQLLQPETDIDLHNLFFMNSRIGTVFGIANCRITRCGYTGEDGVEISVDADKAPLLVDRLLESKSAKVRLAGLGARDALRLEAGLCLYGNDIDEDKTPIEAGLAFTIAKRRRATKDFPGADIIMDQLNNKKWPKQRVGLIAEPGRAPRGHLPLIDLIDDATVGFVTSGCPSPNLHKNIAMAYVDRSHANIGREMFVDFGGKRIKVKVTKMPFVPTRYYIAK